MQQLREVDGENERQSGFRGRSDIERLIEVTNQGNTTQMTRDEVERLKEREDIRVADNGDKATVLNRLRG